MLCEVLVVGSFFFPHSGAVSEVFNYRNYNRNHIRVDRC